MLYKLSIWLVVLIVMATRAAALEPDQILLVVNANVPESRGLAEFYKTARLIPDGRIVALKLPIGDEIGLPLYEREVVPALRRFLRDNHLENKVTCLVTFYGVPLRIVPGQRTQEEKDEAAALQAELPKLLSQLSQKVQEMEARAKAFDSSFTPLQGDDVEHLARRGEAAMSILGRRVMSIEDPQKRMELAAEVVEVIKQLIGPAGVLRVYGTPEALARQTPEAGAKLKELAAQLQTMGAAIAQLQEQRQDPAARARLRKLVGDGFGLIELIRLMQVQLDYVGGTNSTAAFDSELALLWWNYYPRSGWQTNSLYHRAAERARAGARPTLMVSRLDAPQSGQVRDMILTSLKAERDGLKGKVILDSRGIRAEGESGRFGGYGWYDQSIRNLAELIRTKTDLALLHDDSPEVLPAASARDVALYCGWYSLRNYVPACQFSHGAVGFHVASLELVSLRGANETGWVHGLLSDGMAATTGAVAEPYLGAFPAADDFFALLMTGKLTLAEVYWKTAPLTSWMMTLIGDPLYTPFKKNPALAVRDLPERLRAAVNEKSTTQPAE